MFSIQFSILTIHFIDKICYFWQILVLNILISCHWSSVLSFTSSVISSLTEFPVLLHSVRQISQVWYVLSKQLATKCKNTFFLKVFFGPEATWNFLQRAWEDICEPLSFEWRKLINQVLNIWFQFLCFNVDIIIYILYLLSINYIYKDQTTLAL